FIENAEVAELPGPGAYVQVSDDTMIRKTFNVSLGHGITKCKDVAPVHCEMTGGPNTMTWCTTSKRSISPVIEPLVGFMRAFAAVS
ncbi:hypothetical protein SeLEV6574_g07825, partial [Synchytrium endobioticum]